MLNRGVRTPEVIYIFWWYRIAFNYIEYDDGVTEVENLKDLWMEGILDFPDLDASVPDLDPPLINDDVALAPALAPGGAILSLTDLPSDDEILLRRVKLIKRIPKKFRRMVGVIMRSLLYQATFHNDHLHLHIYVCQMCLAVSC